MSPRNPGLKNTGYQCLSPATGGAPAHATGRDAGRRDTGLARPAPGARRPWIDGPAGSDKGINRDD